MWCAVVSYIYNMCHKLYERILLSEFKQLLTKNHVLVFFFFFYEKIIQNLTYL